MTFTLISAYMLLFFFFQAEDGIRDLYVTGVQTCALPISHWASARTNATERIVLEFDRPQQISCLVYEVEECRQERTQEVRVEVSSDHGRTYRQVLVQEYTFSPQGAIFQHEELRLELPAITHLSLTIVPNKSGSGIASLTALRLFA